MKWFKSYSLLCLSIFGIFLIAIVLHFTLFDGVHIGEKTGIVKKVYANKYNGYKSIGSTIVNKAKLKLETGEIVAVFCQIKCRNNSKITVQVYKPVFSNNMIYIYKTTSF